MAMIIVIVSLSIIQPLPILILIRILAVVTRAIASIVLAASTNKDRLDDISVVMLRV